VVKKRINRNRRVAGRQPEPLSVDAKAKLGDVFDIPQSAMAGMPQIELSGNREALVDGCQGVLEYDDTVIKLSTGKMSVMFTGRSLQIKVLTHNSAIVGGYITGIEFIT